jgi:hypothetical protein
MHTPHYSSWSPKADTDVQKKMKQRVSGPSEAKRKSLRKKR